MTDFITDFRQQVRCFLAGQIGGARLQRRPLLPLLLVLSVAGSGALSCGGDTTTGPAPRTGVLVAPTQPARGESGACGAV